MDILPVEDVAATVQNFYQVENYSLKSTFINCIPLNCLYKNKHIPVNIHFWFMQLFYSWEYNPLFLPCLVPELASARSIFFLIFASVLTFFPKIHYCWTFLGPAETVGDAWKLPGALGGGHQNHHRLHRKVRESTLLYSTVLRIRANIRQIRIRLM